MSSLMKGQNVKKEDILSTGGHVALKILQKNFVKNPKLPKAYFNNYDSIFS